MKLRVDRRNRGVSGPALTAAAPAAARSLSLLAAAATLCVTSLATAQKPSGTVLTGQAAFTNWDQQQPGIRHRITTADLPEPKPEEAVNNTAHLVDRPEGALPTAPPGFKVTLYAGGDAPPMQRADNKQNMAAVPGTFRMPRLLRTAPNGDMFLADSGAGTVFVLRGVGPDGRAAKLEKFATGLDHPFGIAFYPVSNPEWVYVGTATTVQRFPYRAGDLHATGAAQTIVPDIPGYAQLTGGGHWTRDVVVSADGKHLLVSVGSGSNVDDADTHPREFHRADILEYTPEGKFEKVYASGLRNCVGEAINPVTHQLWCSTNERDDLGNHLVPDYVTSVPEGSFFGWPWYYMGPHRDPRREDPCAEGTGPNPQLAKPMDPASAGNCKRVDLSKQVKTPDVLVQPHMASLQMTFYPGRSPQFPQPFAGGIFAAEHGSWNRAQRAGYNVIYIPLVNGKATGEYDDFLDGFVTSDGKVWGRPVGVAVAKDGSLLVTDDGSRSVWRVTYTGSGALSTK